MSNKRKTVDRLLQIITYSAALVAVLILSLIVIYIVKNGYSLINIKLITNNYHTQYYNGGIEKIDNFNLIPKPENLDDTDYYSEKWGIAFKDDVNIEGKPTIMVTYVDRNSPLKQMYDKNNPDNHDFKIEVNNIVVSITFYDKDSALSIHGAQHMINQLDESAEFREIVFSSLGGGIRGSLITTLYTIGLTLLFALPIGIFTAIYLNEFAKKNKITNTIRSMIETLTGVPSIIFGLMGLAVFVPITIKYTPADSANILSGSLTLAVILLPVIIRSTEESLKVVPDSFRRASLALGANNTQTTFKVVLPSALPGILTATLLAIGRVIGESAALIFAIGTAIKDEISIFGKSTTLAVHIWALMTDEPANIELACAISIIILLIVLILNLSIKLISKTYLKKA